MTGKTMETTGKVFESPRYRNPLAKGEHRNKACVCGSGKKIKKCCGVKSSLTKDEYDHIVKKINDFNIQFDTVFKEQALKAKEMMEGRDGQEKA